MDSLANHFKIEAEVLPDRTRQVSYVADRIRGLRRVQIVEEWVRKERLGTGASGSVFLEERVNDKQLRAVKEVRRSGEIKDYLELVAMARLSKDEDLFVQLFGWYASERHVYLAMEYLPLGDISTCYEDPLPETEVKVVGLQLLEGLEKMHKLGITHRDIKPQNILVVHKSPIWVKIADFGISKGIDRGETALRSKVGTQEFAAPEVLGILDDGPESSEYTNAVDLWSLGCLLYYLISKCLPFPRPGSLWKYCIGKTEFPESLLKDQRMSTEGILFLKNLMAPRPLDRMSASDALKVPWIRDQSEYPNRVNDARDMQTLEFSMESLQPNSMNEIKPQMAKVAEIKSGYTRPDVLRDPLTDVVEAPTSIAPMNFPQDVLQASETSRSNVFRLEGNDEGRMGEPDNPAMILPETKVLESRDGEWLRLLREAGYDIGDGKINAMNSDGRTALHRAAYNGQEGVVRLLLSRSDVEADLGTGVRLATTHERQWFSRRDKSQLLKRKLLGETGLSPLALAAEKGHEKVVGLLLAREDVKVDHQSKDGRSPLLMGAANGHATTLLLLLQNGADVKVAKTTGETALHLAAEKGHESAVRLLLEKGAVTNSKNDQGQTALHLAAMRGHKSTAQLLIDMGAVIHGRDYRGRSALHVAAFNENEECMRLLLERGADTKAADTDGITALHLAAAGGKEECVRLLLENGADVKAKDQKGETALDRAVGKDGIVQLLKQKGAGKTSILSSLWRKG